MSVLLLKAGIPLLLGIAAMGQNWPLASATKNLAYSITSSAAALRPSTFAAFMLITNSNLLACTTGSSAGLAPVSTRPAETPIAPFDDAGFSETLVERGH